MTRMTQGHQEQGPGHQEQAQEHQGHREHREHQERPLLNRRLAGFGTTIFAEMSALAARTGSINLGQGFPDTDGPEEIREAAVRALRAGHGNQYPPGPGIPELRTAVAAHQERFYGLTWSPDTEVLVTTGA
ncbi:aminotransferase class I/II-fold pyridoxal phosphate-dependent enzyme, partial [Streptomyces sp. DSM 41036]